MHNLIDISNSILRVAQDTDKCIREGNIKKAIEFFQVISSYDMSEAGIVKNALNDKVLMDEINQISSLAKDAVAMLSSNKPDLRSAGQIVFKIAEIERNKIPQIKKNDENLQKLKKYWTENFYNTIFYHGTNTLSLSRILKEGLVPMKNVIDDADIRKLDSLLRKAGNPNGIGYFYNLNVEKNGGQAAIFLTIRKDDAISYAKSSPEFWSQFIGEKLWRERKYDEALLSLCKRIANMPDDSKHLEEFRKAFYENRNEFLMMIEMLSSLSKSEIQEVIRIFDSYWRLMDKIRPVLLSVSIQAPVIIKTIPYFHDFDLFVEVMKSMMEKAKNSPELFNDITKFADHVRSGALGLHNLPIEGKIDPSFITNWEYV